MSLAELFIIAVGLSMDAFAVSVCKGLSMQKMNVKNAVIVGLYFGGFQATMPLLGYGLGIRFQQAITAYDHWIAFILLAMIGVNMIREALHPDEQSVDASVKMGDMLVLAVGVTFAFLNVQIIPAVSFIGCTTFILSIVGVKVGTVFGCRYKARAELAGGAILVLMGVKILIEHLFF